MRFCLRVATRRAVSGSNSGELNHAMGHEHEVHHDHAHD